jgi:hypothetical protein
MWNLTALAATMAIAGCAMMEKKEAPPAGPLPGGTVSEGLVTATARVKAIDHKTRMVTLERADGSEVKFRAGDEVRNLAQVKAGDEVAATYYESIAYQVKKPGEAEVGGAVAEEVERAKAGEKPGIAGARVTTVTSKIAAIDKKAGTVTLQGADGEQVVVKVRNPANLERVAVGDLVEITMTEAVAIAVEGKK